MIAATDELGWFRRSPFKDGHTVDKRNSLEEATVMSNGVLFVNYHGCGG